MALTLKNRVYETTTTTGTGAYLLAGVYNASCRPFADAGNGNTIPYLCEEGTKSEWGIGTYDSGANTLARTTILGNHLGTTAAINWGAGTKNIFSPNFSEFFSWLTFSTSFTVEALKVAEASAPSTPASGFGMIYEKTDGKLYFKNDAGTEYDLTASPSAIDDLSDVVITTAASGDMLQYNGANWVNVTWLNSVPTVIDFGGKTSFEIPNSASPTVDANGEIAVDTTVTDWSHGVLKYFGGEELGVVAMPITQFTTPADGYVVAYNATNDEFELVAPSGGGGATTALDNLAAVAINADLTPGADLGASLGSGTARFSEAYVGGVYAGSSDTNQLVLYARDVDGAAWTPFITITSGNTPTCDLDATVTVGGAAIYSAGGTDVALADGGTGASLTDPNADRIMFWDDSGGGITWLTVGSGLSITGTTISASGGGGLSYFTEAQSTSSPNGTVYVSSFTASGGATNIDATLAPKGTGAILAQVPDGTSTAGNKRGARAVDFSTSRTAAAQVASGTAAFNVGINNTASGDYSATIGYGHTASGHHSLAVGREAVADHRAEFAISSGYRLNLGDSQGSMFHWSAYTVDATQTEAYSGATGTNRFTVASGATYGFELHLLARRASSSGESAFWVIRGCIANNAGTTALVGSITKTQIADNALEGWDVTAEADNTNDALSVKVTGATDSNVIWSIIGIMTKVSE